MYRFALHPRWIAGHLVVAGLVAAMVSLGLWQLRRLEERRAANEAVAARASMTARAEIESGADADELAWHRFSLTGRFDPSSEVLVRGRIRNGLPGFEVLTPFVLAGDRAVLVNRGWVPQVVGDRWPDPSTLPPTGDTVVVGTARPAESAALRPSEGSGGVTVISGIRLDELDARMTHELAPVWLVAERGASQGELPAPLPPRDASDGPHLSYAIQWFLFASIGGVGWTLLVRQSAQRRHRPPPTGPADLRTADPVGPTAPGDGRHPDGVEEVVRR